MKTQTTTVKPRRARRTDAVENRQRILAAAHARFAAEGLGTEMDAIARDAGVAVGTLYHHFGTKEKLLEAIVLDGLQTLEAYLQTLADEPDPWTAVEQLVRYLAEQSYEDQSFGAIISAQPSVKALTHSKKRGLGPGMQKILDRAKAAGALRADVMAADIPLLIAGVSKGEVNATTRERTLTIILNGLRE